VTTIRTIPDYPKPGIMFRDITTLLGDAARVPPGGR
jgi:adenine phosphoribosyltransferase